MKILINNYIVFNKLVRLSILSPKDLKAIKFNASKQELYFKKYMTTQNMHSRNMPLSIFLWSTSLEGDDYWRLKNEKARKAINI